MNKKKPPCLQIHLLDDISAQPGPGHHTVGKLMLVIRVTIRLLSYGHIFVGKLGKKSSLPLAVLSASHLVETAL